MLKKLLNRKKSPKEKPAASSNTAGTSNGTPNVRTNIPHGISQHNRVHPLFIILRRLGTTEENEFRKLIRKTVWSNVFNGIIVFWSILAAVYFHWVSGIMGAFIAAAIIWLIALFQEIGLLRSFSKSDALVFPKVNKMIHSDDYSQANLNYEALVNLIGSINSNIAYLREKQGDVISITVQLCIILAAGYASWYIMGVAGL